MAVTIEISNTVNLRRARKILGARSDAQTAEIAIDRIVKENEPEILESETAELPESFWDELFSDPPLPKGTTIKAVLDDRDEARY